MILNDTLIRSAKAQTKPYKLSRELGLFVLINPNGTKWWRFAYSFDGREKLLSFGTYPEVPLKLARERRDEARKLVASGIDPSVQRQTEKTRKAQDSANTFELIAKEWLAMRADSMAVGTHNKARWMLETFAYPYIGLRAITSIEPADVLEAIRAVEARGLLETAHRVKARISEVIRYAIATSRAKSDPCRDLRGALKPKNPTRHFAALTDPRDVGVLLLSIDSYRGTPEVSAALKLNPLLFVRPGELRTAQWPQFDLDSAAPSWRFYVSKTKTWHIVPLPTQAVSILRELYPLTGASITAKPEAPRYVFPSTRTRERPMSENSITAALRSLGYTGEQMTGHGFRAMARTLLAELGWMPDIIERQLAHKPVGPLGSAYDRAQFLQDRRKMMQTWADYLDQLRKEVVTNVRFAKAA